ncbi:DUF4240 domain-containing protein [Streptomyces showdoensis]|uniref:DUF4240 domain-containing protein n=1 Tax=Streptomyces showdoensis TaxID=68268 RepID=A0A2P2GGA2_STREW|nr:DUF4240 domain-containing protein [Streptomyces showdoensis]KKZ70537.1 hypothetical protein VO63_28430 [Streptomyces showdoensis]
MDEKAFWALMGELRHRPGSRDDRLQWLRGELARGPAQECVAFQVELEAACDRSYRADLWSAAERILGGRCSDDGFHYFRLWLVGLGREVFEEALVSPDGLAGVPEVLRLAGRSRDSWCEAEEWPDLEALDYVAADAYEDLTGVADEGEAFFDALDAAQGEEAPDPEAPPREEPLDEAGMPRLAALFPARAGRG